MNRHPIYACFLVMLCSVAWAQAADAPCKSGPEVGQRTGPYSAIVSVGPQRGQSACYICETAERPAIIVFARTPTPALGKLVFEMDQAKVQHKAADLRAWVTFLSDEQPKLDPKVLTWSKTHALKNIPVGIFEDVEGPPTYLLAPEADVTVLLCVKQKVALKFAFRANEFDEKKIATIMKELPQIVGKK